MFLWSGYPSLIVSLTRSYDLLPSILHSILDPSPCSYLAALTKIRGGNTAPPPNLINLEIVAIETRYRYFLVLIAMAIESYHVISEPKMKGKNVISCINIEIEDNIFNDRFLDHIYNWEAVLLCDMSKPRSTMIRQLPQGTRWIGALPIPLFLVYHRALFTFPNNPSSAAEKTLEW